jgi:hypothetical protein
MANAEKLRRKLELASRFEGSRHVPDCRVKKFIEFRSEPGSPRQIDKERSGVSFSGETLRRGLGGGPGALKSWHRFSHSTLRGARQANISNPLGSAKMPSVTQTTTQPRDGPVVKRQKLAVREQPPATSRRKPQIFAPFRVRDNPRLGFEVG